VPPTFHLNTSHLLLQSYLPSMPFPDGVSLYFASLSNREFKKKFIEVFSPAFASLTRHW
jgi:hypothetical protein